jgi:hypothetical protein
MRNLDGSSGWRPFLLPFESNETAGLPTRLEINVVFSGRGTVHLSPLRVEQYSARPKAPAGAPPGSRPGISPRAWWGTRTGAVIGAAAGTALGLLGALVGTLCGTGVARRLVLTLATLATACGLIALIAGFVALGLRQPYVVYYPLLLLGGIASVVNGGLLPVIRRRYAEIELRRMSALDVNRP